MRFFVLFFVLACAGTGFCLAGSLSDTVKKDFEKPVFGAYSPQKGNSISQIEIQIQEKQSTIRKINEDKKLTSSQKKSKVSLLEKELNTLIKQKENIEKAGG